MANESLKVGERLEVSVLTETVCELLRSAGLAVESATRAAHLLVYAQRSGVDTHGVTHLPAYVRRLLDGSINSSPKFVFENTDGAASVLDANDALGCLAADAAITEAMRRANQFGVGSVAVRNSSHFGPAGVYVEAAAKAGYVAIALSNASATMAPWGGRDSILGTNPLAAAFPRANAAPVVIDMATSTASRAHVRRALANNSTIPPDWALDQAGRPTTDPAEALRGSMQPMGGPKGSALALMVELLCASLAGATPGYSIRVPQDTSPESCKVSHFFIALDPNSFAGATHVELSVDNIAKTIEQSTPRESSEPVRLPGGASASSRKWNDEHGIEVTATLLQALRDTETLITQARA
jgi:LDH2 family malate/lactate/ureidoglycolate dehydrogenase